VASFPADLGEWNQNEHPYYLEVFGEAEPVLGMTHAEVIPAGGTGAAVTTAAPVYEYWWTIGHGGNKTEHRHLFENRKKVNLWHRLDDIAARVYLYFPISGAALPRVPGRQELRGLTGPAVLPAATGLRRPGPRRRACHGP